MRFKNNLKNSIKPVQQRYPAYLEDQREYFDELITSDWSSYISARWDETRKFEVDMIFQIANAQRVLDVGCGCGYHDLLIAEKAGVTEVVGIDNSSASIDAANRIYPHHKVRRIQSDIFSMDSGDYDLVVSFQVIEHVANSLAFLKALANQVRPNGFIAIATPNRERLQNKLRRALWLAPSLEDPQHFIEYTSNEMIRIGKMAGLSTSFVFGYGLSLSVPKFSVPIIPSSFWKLGTIFPSHSDRFCIVFYRS